MIDNDPPPIINLRVEVGLDSVDSSTYRGSETEESEREVWRTPPWTALTEPTLSFMCHFVGSCFTFPLGRINYLLSLFPSVLPLLNGLLSNQIKYHPQNTS